ncbi:MAG: short-chain dehydrogenase/reductase [Rhodospirillaceae bacterium]
MDLGLKGKWALITGGSKGIGLAIAKVLAAEGCNLHLAARTEADLETVRDEITSGYGVEVEIHARNLAQPQDLQALASACPDVDILINNAGAIPQGTLEHLDDATLRESWELKLFGFINLTREIYPAMKKRGSGVIVNVIGGAAENPTSGYIAGAMANTALANFSKALGKESTFHGVRVVGIHPAMTRTERMDTIHRSLAEQTLGDPERWKEVIPKMPFERPTEPEEVANMVAFMASEKASYTSGVVYSVSGGV